MAKPEWGIKRTCLNCGARFYDMKRSPIVCPKCEAVFEPEQPAKPRRDRKKEVVKAPVVAPVPDDEIEDDLDVEEEEDDEDLMEDASDLGEDDDDLGEVKEHLEVDDDD